MSTPPRRPRERRRRRFRRGLAARRRGPRLAQGGPGADAVRRGVPACARARRLLEIGSHQGRSTVVLGAVALRLGRRAWSRSTPSSTGGSSAARPPASSSSATSSEAGRRGRGASPSRSTPPRRGPAGQSALRPPLHRRQARLLDPRGRPALAPAPAGGRPGAGPRRLLLDRRDARASCAKCCRPRPALRAPRRTRWRSSEKARPSRADRLRILAELPWWLRNVVLKVLLRLRLRPVARLLGHDSPYDPY